VLTDAFPASRRALDAYFEAIRRFFAETPFLNPEISPGFMAGASEFSASLESFLSDHGAEPDLIELLGSYGSFLCGMEAHETPLGTSAGVLGSYFRSAHWIVGGGEAIALALEQALAEAGVDVECRCRVAAITATDSRQVSGVRLDDDEMLPAETVVFTGHPGQLASLLAPGAVRPAYRNRLEALESTPPFVVTYFSCPKLPSAPERNLYFWPDPDDGEEVSPIALMGVSPVPNGTGRARAIIEGASPSDIEMSFKDSPKRRPPGYRDWKAQRCADVLARSRGLAPGAVEGAELIDAATPASYRDWTGTVGGSAYGAKQKAQGLPLTARTPLNGLVLAGQGLLMPGVMGAAASGAVAASHVLGSRTAWEVLRQA